MTVYDPTDTRPPVYPARRTRMAGLTDAQLDALIRHAQDAHLHGADYDAIPLLVGEVRRLRAVLRDIVAYTAEHLPGSEYHRLHDCHEEWTLLRDEASRLLDQEDDR